MHGEVGRHNAQVVVLVDIALVDLLHLIDEPRVAKREDDGDEHEAVAQQLVVKVFFQLACLFVPRQELTLRLNVHVRVVVVARVAVVQSGNVLLARVFYVTFLFVQTVFQEVLLQLFHVQVLLAVLNEIILFKICFSVL